MMTKTFAGALVGSFLLSTALTPARAADVTNDRLLNPQREPQNWILHHGNYQGHRFSLLKDINTDTEPTAYNPELGLLYIPSIEGCNYLETIEQKDFVDQRGTIKPRERFHGGADQVRERLYGGLKAVDPTNGEIKADLKLTYPNYSGALATAGNLVFLGHADGTVSAHDAKTLQERWTFNIGTGINAPPISFAVNGKQYIAVLAGSKQSPNIVPFSPELKNTSSASMLFVFSL